jgi:hypothetical protein
VLTAWLLSLQPARLVAVSSGAHYATSTRLTVEDLDVTVKLTGGVGRNGMRIEVAAPATGLTDFVITFTAPAGTQAASVVLTVPAELAGAGAAELDVVEGIPLDVAGVWTMSVAATTPTGPITGLKTFAVIG